MIISLNQNNTTHILRITFYPFPSINSEDSDLDERDWKLLLQRITDGKCTPFLGPHINKNILPANATIAQSWATEHGYPLIDDQDLARVALYLAVLYDPVYPKEQLQAFYENVDPPQFDDPHSPYTILANLHLPIYITSNYDNFMEDALRYHHKDPRRELCRWNQTLQRTQPSILDTGFKPTSADPLVYHLNGHYQTPESVVLTEDDYLDFLVNISSAEYELPPRIQQSFTGSSLLFIGFNPFAWNFRVLFRGLVAATEASLRRISVTVQMPPLPDDVPDTTREKVQNYLSDYFDATDRRMRVYWGASDQFLAELNQRWQGLTTDKAAAEEAQPQINIIQLQQNLANSFSMDELREMVQFNLRIDYETFSDTKPPFIMELIVYLQHRKRLHELIETCQKLRPSIQWI